MKKLVQIVFIMVFILNMATPGYCGGPMKKFTRGPMKKLTRGLSNLVTCPLEIPNRIKMTAKEGKLIDTIGCGIPKALAMMIFRAAIGFYEVMTFPIPIPENYEPMITDPEFFWKSS